MPTKKEISKKNKALITKSLRSTKLRPRSYKKAKLMHENGISAAGKALNHEQGSKATKMYLTDSKPKIYKNG